MPGVVELSFEAGEGEPAAHMTAQADAGGAGVGLRGIIEIFVGGGLLNS